MQKIIKITLFILGIGLFQLSYSQCTVVVDVANLQHIDCPNGGAVGAATISQTGYQNFAWNNITNGQLYGNGTGVTNLSNLDAGFYVITASNPYNSGCPSIIYSDTFEIKEASPNFQFSPSQACPNLCNVSVAASMQIAIPQVLYTLSFDGAAQSALPTTINNQCGGSHSYEIFADGVGCGTENIGISQLAQMNLSTTVTNATCTQAGSATVNITSVGASGLNTYCQSSPQYNNYTTIDFVELIGDNTAINNSTAGSCDMYEDYTAQSADLTPNSIYNLKIDLGSCQSVFLDDLARVYIDWNIDGVFDITNELVGQINPTLSPSSTTLTFTVPTGATPGQSRMRIVAQNSQYQSTNVANPCDYNTAWFGATEDYTIVVNGSVANPVSYLWSDGQTTQTAANLSAGTYTVTLTDANGCSANDTAIVGGGGNVNVIASADTIICNGGFANVTANGSGTGTYSWIPAAAFVDPNQQSPTLNAGLNTTTIFSVTYTDGNGCIATDNVTVTVNAIPTVNLVAIPNPACVGDNITLTATTSLPVNLYRFQYNSGGGWINMTSPQMGTMNPIIFNNITSSTQYRVKVREENGCNTSNWSPTITVPVSIITTPPINHN